MRGISDKVLHSSTFRYLILYLAIMTTVTFFLVSYNQSSVCSTQRENATRTNEVYHSIEHAIRSQVDLYKTIRESEYSNEDLKIKLTLSITYLENELRLIKEKRPETVNCFIF